MNQNTSSSARIQRLCHTLEASVSPYHCIKEAERQLSAASFQPLSLTENWQLQAGGRYFINAFDSTLLAFSLPEHIPSSYRPLLLRMAAAHTDCP